MMLIAIVMSLNMTIAALVAMFSDKTNNDNRNSHEINDNLDINKSSKIKMMITTMLIKIIIKMVRTAMNRSSRFFILLKARGVIPGHHDNAKATSRRSYCR